MIKLKSAAWIIIISCMVTYPVFSQDNSNTVVYGKVVDYLSNEPLGFATVMIYDSEALDSAKMADAWNKGVYSDSTGMFQINGIPTGEYFVQVSFMGYKTKKTKKFLVENRNAQIDLKEIHVEESIEFLSGVEVIGERSTFNLDIDRKIYNVSEDILSESMSATEILNNVPSVSIDYNGRVNLRGTPNINFFINGRPSPLMRANPTAYLNSIPANSIEKIEVITNPSARYRPDGAGGIINIVLKGAGQGLEGSIQGNAGNLDRYTGNISLGYSKEDFSFYGTYSLRHTTTPQDISDIRLERDGEGNDLNEFLRETQENYKELSNIGNGGLTYSFKERNVLEISGEYLYSKSDNSSTAQTVTEDKETGENEIYTTDRVFTGLELEWQLAAALEHEFLKEEHTLALEVAYGQYAEEEDNNFNEKFTQPDYREDISHYRITKGGPVTEIALEYANPLPGDREIELGYDGEFLFDNIRNLSQYQAPDGSWIYDANRTNNFDFTQNINSIWAIFTQEIESISLSAGLRGEDVNITSKLIQQEADSIIPNDYSKLYPSFNVTYEKSDNEQIQFNYSKRVNRADSDEHNPFAEYDDPRTREVGNPYLKPEVIHSFELGYSFQKDNFSVIPTAYFRYKKDAFTEIREIVEDSILQTSLSNLDVEKAGGLEFVVTGNIKDKIGLNFSANFFYSTLDASNLGYSSDISQFNWDAKLIANFTITKTTFAQLNAYYRSGRQTAQGHFEPVPLFNLGFRQDLFRKRASLSLTISDVFNSVEWESITDTRDLYQYTTYGRNSQIVYLGFTYRFGKNYQNRKPQDLQFEDEIEAGKPPPEEEE